VSERFTAEWLTLREPFDRAARSMQLARRLAEHLPTRPRLLDLGAGTGSMFRFLAPIIGRRQDWLLVDADAALLDDTFGRTAAWARRRGYAATSASHELRISTPSGLWCIQTVQRDLARPLAQAGDVDAVVCSALLDLVSAAWLERWFDALTVAFLACLTVDGRDTWLPPHPMDPSVHVAFRRDQRRDKGLGRALGTTAPFVALKALAARGFTAASAPADWRIPRAALGMQRALIEGRGAGHPDWEEMRLRQAINGRLAIRIGHRDILAFPPTFPLGG
jgi:SAM-dependent methyltransferase